LRRALASCFRFLEILNETGTPPPAWLDPDETAGGILVLGDV
jgi:hypothetical protein